MNNKNPSISERIAARIAARVEEGYKELDKREERAAEYAKEQAKRKHEVIQVYGDVIPAMEIGSYLPIHKMHDPKSRRESEE